MLIREFIDYYIVNGDLCNEAVTDIGRYGSVPSEEQETNLRTILNHMWRGIRKFNEEFYLNIEKFEIPHQDIPFIFTPTPATETGGIPEPPAPPTPQYTFSIIRTLLQVVTKDGYQLPIGQKQRNDLWVEEDANTAQFTVRSSSSDAVSFKERFPITAYYLRSPKMLKLYDYYDDGVLELPQALYEALASYVSYRIVLTMGTGDGVNARNFMTLHKEDLRIAKSKIKIPTLFTKPDMVLNKGFV